MKIELISLAMVKILLGITGSTYDDNINIMIPLVSADVREILNDQYNVKQAGVITSGSTELSFTTLPVFYPNTVYTIPLYKMGQVLYHPNLPDDTYITEFDEENSVYTLNQAATGDGDYFYPTINIRQWMAIAKMIFYRTGKMSTTIKEGKELTRRMGPVTITFQPTMSKLWNYPKELIDDLGYPRLRTC